MRFSDRVALITGAASGLGLEVARQMKAEGASLVLVDWDVAAVAAAAKELDAVRLPGDVSRPATAEAAVEMARSTFGRLDVLFNNAGIDPLRARSVVETEEEDWDRVMDVNVKSAYLFTRAAVPLMLEGAGAAGGSIVNTASIAGVRAAGQEAAYSASKAAMVSLTQSVAVDFAPRVRANCVCPGFMEKVMTDRRRELTDDEVSARYAYADAHVPLGRQGSYAEVARCVLFLASDDASYVTGAALVVDGGMLLT